MLGDDPLAEPLERQRRRPGGEPVEALLEGLEEPRVPLGDVFRNPLLEPDEERPTRRRPPQQDEPVVRDADERRGEHAEQRLVVVAVVQQPQVVEEVDHLLLVVVVAAGRAEGRQAERAQLLLVGARVGARREEQDDLARRRLAGVDQVAYARRDVARLGLAPVDAGLRVARLVGHEQLDRRPEGGVREAARGLERLERVAEVGREEVVDHVEHLGPRAVVLGQGEHAADLVAPLAEDLDVRVPEAVDRLELVADEEDLGLLLGEQVDQLALQPVRVLELVDHDRAEAPALALADLGVLAQELARQQLQVLEVERRLAVLGLAVGAVVGEQELLQLLAVARRERLERGLLDRVPRLLELGRAQVGEVEQLLRAVGRVEEAQGRLVFRGGDTQLCQPLVQPRLDRRFEPQLEPGRAQRLVHAGQHPPQPAAAVRGEQPHPRLVVAAELLERRAEGLAAQHAPLAVVEHAEARVDPGRERVRLQQPVAEAVDGRDPGGVEVTREVVTVELEQPLADPAAQLAGRALGVRDHEQRVDVEAALADRLAEALDDHGRLAGPGARRDEDDALLLDRPELLAVRSFDRAHERLTRQVGQSSHHVGQEPPRGSCRTSPSRIRSTTPTACSRARSMPPQNASSST